MYVDILLANSGLQRRQNDELQCADMLTRGIMRILRTIYLYVVENCSCAPSTTSSMKLALHATLPHSHRLRLQLRIYPHINILQYRSSGRFVQRILRIICMHRNLHTYGPTFRQQNSN